MKKKILALSIVLCLAVTAIAGATLAYFTDEDEAENVFTFGSVKIYQNEQQRFVAVDDNDTELDNDRQFQDIRVEDDGLEDFEDYKNVFPAVHNKLGKVDINVNGYDFKIRSLEGNYVDKIVSVTNYGTEEAYIRTIFAIPSINGYDDTADASENPLHWNYLDASDFEGTGWDWNGSNDAEVTEQREYLKAVLINNIEYDIYVATYNKAVPAGETTSPSMVGFYLDDDVNCDENGYFSMQNGKRIDISEWMKPGDNGKVTMSILVATQACQTAGFDDAWEALDTAFGVIDENNLENLPWDATKPQA